MKPEFVLKNRNFLLLYLGNLVSNMGTTIYNFAISLYILKIASEITDKPATIAGIYLMTGALIYFILSPFGGALVDRLDKVKVVFITDYIRGITIVLAGLAIFSGVGTESIIIILFITTAILGINGALFGPAAAGLPIHILDKDQMQQSSSLMQGTNAIYQIAGALIGGLIYVILDIEWIFIINGISFIVSGFSEMFITTTKQVISDAKLTIKGTIIDVKEGIKYLYNYKPILNLVIVASLLNFFTVPVIANGIPYLFQIELGKPPIYMSIINISYLIGVVVISIVLGSKAQKEKVSPLINKGFIGMGLFFTLFVVELVFLLNDIVSFDIFMISSVITLIIMGVFNGMLNIPFSTAIMKTVDHSMIGRIISVIGVISNGLTPIAMGLGGIVIDNFGLSILFYLAAASILITSVLTVTNKEIQKL